ncbi:MAG TPA: helix-turn-helix transcriptional regulator [Nocardioidaceae bacterium]|nr:helix-turn-helix transcriptional regulator [Nocardioidaceae bacterium]
MTSEPTTRLSRYDELGTHRHLLISERLRQRRRELGLTQKEVVARLRRIGVLTTNKALSSLEHGAGLDVCKLPELARALDCSLTYLVGLTDDPLSWEPDADRWVPAKRPRITRVAAPPSDPAVEPLRQSPTPVPQPTGPMVLGPMG